MASLGVQFWPWPRSTQTSPFQPKSKWLDILDQVRGGKGGKRGLVIRPRGGQAEAAASAGLRTAQDVVLSDHNGRRYVHQGEVFGVLMAALLEVYTLKGLNEKVKKEYSNITTVVVDDFLRALDVCYYLAGVSAPAGSMRFASLCPPPLPQGLLAVKKPSKGTS